MLKKIGQPGTKEYTKELTNSIFADGTWPIFYLSASISTPIILLATGFPVTIKNFTIIFLISFFTFYCTFQFVLHHYLSIIKKDISNYIAKNGEQKDINNIFTSIDTYQCKNVIKI